MHAANPSLHVAVIGGGTMGLGIAYSSATAGMRTTTVEVSADRRVGLQAEFVRAVEVGRERGRLSDATAEAAVQGMVIVADVEEIPLGVDVVVETVPERRDLKRAVLAAALARRPTVLASNTSSLSIDDLAAGLDDPTRLVGLHFFNPVWSIHLVEVVRGAKTSPAVLDASLQFVAALGKQSAVVTDTPGFATSRLDLVASLEAMRMLQEGVGSADDIDRAVQLAYRHPVGPLRLSDIVGLDVRLDIARQLEGALGSRFSPPQVLVDMVGRGDLGRKTGRGFYVWEEGA